jgi:hypothetical protein
LGGWPLPYQSVMLSCPSTGIREVDSVGIWLSVTIEGVPDPWNRQNFCLKRLGAV